MLTTENITILIHNATSQFITIDSELSAVNVNVDNN